MKPLVSIIIPTYNRSQLLAATLDSVKSQSYGNWECIVVDDGSTDGTAALMATYTKSDARFVYLKRPEHRASGGNAARNYGFEQSKGAYTQWFDSDDLMGETLLETQLAALDASGKEFSICRHDRYNDDFTKMLKEGTTYQPEYGYYLDYVTNQLAANLPTILFSRAVVAPFALSESLYKSQEFEFLQRFFKKNEQLGTYVDQSLVKVRRHANSITERGSDLRSRSALTVLLTTYLSLPKEAPKAVRKVLTLKYLKTLYIAAKEQRGTVLASYTLKLYHFSILKAILAIPYILIHYLATVLHLTQARHFKKVIRLYR